MYYTDSDECSTNPCHEDATCSALDGSYTCECNDGFTGDGLSCKSTSILDHFMLITTDLEITGSKDFSFR